VKNAQIGPTEAAEFKRVFWPKFTKPHFSIWATGR
jgi:hypothetical protein